MKNLEEVRVDIEELERLEKEATPGPWKWNEHAGGEEGSGAITFQHKDLGTTDVFFRAYWNHKDEELTVALRNAFPSMAKELSVLREAVKRFDGIASAINLSSASNGDSCDGVKVIAQEVNAISVWVKEQLGEV